MRMPDNNILMQQVLQQSQQLFEQNRDQHKQNQKVAEEQSQILSEIKDDASIVKATIALLAKDVTEIKGWRVGDVDPAIQRMRQMGWMARGAITVGGVGGTTGLLAAIKAFFYTLPPPH